MEPEAVINLFDSCWFDLEIFKKQAYNSTSSTSQTNAYPKNQENSQKSKLSTQLSIQTRPKHEQITDSLSPNSVLSIPAKEVSEEIKQPKKARSVRKAKKRLSKSLSELEFEEVKGFMDLGFVFSEEDKDSSLVEIIPGLQRFGKKKEENDENSMSSDESTSSVSRPYLSEAWEVSDVRKKAEIPLMNWRVSEIDMKDSLKGWAHSVAAAVR